MAVCDESWMGADAQCGESFAIDGPLPLAALIALLALLIAAASYAPVGTFQPVELANAWVLRQPFEVVGSQHLNREI